MTTRFNSFDGSKGGAFQESLGRGFNRPPHPGVLVAANVRRIGESRNFPALVQFHAPRVPFDPDLDPPLPLILPGGITFFTDESVERIDMRRIAGTLSKTVSVSTRDRKFLTLWTGGRYRTRGFIPTHRLFEHAPKFGDTVEFYPLGRMPVIAYRTTDHYWVMIYTKQSGPLGTSYPSYVAEIEFKLVDDRPSIKMIRAAVVNADDQITPTANNSSDTWPHSEFNPRVFGASATGYNDAFVGPMASKLVGSEADYLFEFNGLERRTDVAPASRGILKADGVQRIGQDVWVLFQTQDARSHGLQRYIGYEPGNHGGLYRQQFWVDRNADNNLPADMGPFRFGDEMQYELEGTLGGMTLAG